MDELKCDDSDNASYMDKSINSRVNPPGSKRHTTRNRSFLQTKNKKMNQLRESTAYSEKESTQKTMMTHNYTVKHVNLNLAASNKAKSSSSFGLSHDAKDSCNEDSEIPRTQSHAEHKFHKMFDQFKSALTIQQSQHTGATSMKSNHSNSSQNDAYVGKFDVSGLQHPKIISERQDRDRITAQELKDECKQTLEEAQTQRTHRREMDRLETSDSKLKKKSCDFLA